MRFVHIADIHWRGLIRHDEYQKVFLELVEKISKQNVDIIFVGGDIFHTKTVGISPEYIKIITWWFKLLSSVAPVHVILGNHDGNLMNASRMDAVTPIIDAIDDNNIVVYKNSGVYPINDEFNFCVFSLFDEENWNKVNAENDKINIACYHGPINHSKTDDGWQIESNIGVEFFRDYDFTFLGDIHKFQYLHYKETKNGKQPWIAYPGSTIQQNYSESTYEHGYLIWDIKTNDDYNVKYYRLTNFNPFLTLRNFSNLNELHQKIDLLPNNARYRIISNFYINNEELKVIKDKISKKKFLDFQYQLNKKEILENSIVTENKNFSKNIRELDCLLDYILLYAKNINFVIDDSKKHLIYSIIKKQKEKLTSEETDSRNVVWTIDNIQWDNFLSYSENNSYDFKKNNGLISLYGQNRSGKSSFLATIMFSLFKSIDRDSKKSFEVINENKEYASSNMILSTSKGNYQLTRKINKKYNTKKELQISNEFDFFHLDENRKLNGDERRETEKLLKDVIGTMDNFLLTGISKQNDLYRFIDEGSSKRKEIISKFLDIDYLYEMFDLVKDEYNVYKNIFKNVKNDFQDRLNNNIEKVRLINNNIDFVSDNIKLLEEKIFEKKMFHQQHVCDNVEEKDVSLVKKRITEILNELEQNKNVIVAHNDKKTKYEANILQIEQFKTKYDIEVIKQELATMLSKEKQYEKVKSEYHIQKNKYEYKYKSTLKLLDVPCGDAFPQCKYIRDSYEDKKQINDINHLVEELYKKHGEIEKEYYELKNKKLEEISKKYDEAINAELNIKNMLSKIDNEIIKKTNANIELEKELEILNKKTPNVLVKYDCKNDLLDLKDKTKIVQQHKNDLQKQYVLLGEIKSNNEKTLEEQKKYLDNFDNYQVYEFLYNCFSKKGLSNLIIKTFLPIINNEISEILRDIFDFNVEIVLDENKQELEVYLIYENSYRTIEMGSGMEKTIASIAIRVALRNITTLSKPDFFIIDEGFGTLDNDNVESCGKLLQKIKTYFRFVLIITHVPSLNQYMDNIIMVHKNEDGYSCMNIFDKLNYNKSYE